MSRSDLHRKTNKLAEDVYEILSMRSENPSSDISHFLPRSPEEEDEARRINNTIRLFSAREHPTLVPLSEPQAASPPSGCGSLNSSMGEEHSSTKKRFKSSSAGRTLFNLSSSLTHRPPQKLTRLR